MNGTKLAVFLERLGQYSTTSIQQSDINFEKHMGRKHAATIVVLLFDSVINLSFVLGKEAVVNQVMSLVEDYKVEMQETFCHSAYVQAQIEFFVWTGIQLKEVLA